MYQQLKRRLLNLLKLFPILIIIAALGCSGARPTVDAPSDETSKENPGDATATDEGDAISNCVAVDADDDMKMLYSDKDDWFFYVPGDSTVDCQSKPGVTQVVLGNTGLVLVLAALTPPDGKTIDVAFQEFSVGFINGVSRSIEFDKPIELTKRPMGEAGRQAMCGEARFQTNNTPSAFLVCITWTENVNKDLLVHSVMWKVEEAEYLSNKEIAWSAMSDFASSWYRDSDTDKEGNLVHRW